jgi:hypothetical protein
VKDAKKPSPPQTTGEASMIVEAVILCDQVRTENNGKLLLIGVYSDVIVVPRLPLPIQLTLAIEVRVVQTGTFKFSIDVTDPLGNHIVEGLAGEGKYEGEDGRTTWFSFPLPPFVLSAEGPYVARIDFDGTPSRHDTFLVRKLVPTSVQVTTSAPN